MTGTVDAPKTIKITKQDRKDLEADGARGSRGARKDKAKGTEALVSEKFLSFSGDAWTTSTMQAQPVANSSKSES